MSFLETVRLARSHLEEQGRVSLRALQREFGLDDNVLDALTEELVDIQQVAAREGKLLSWVGPRASARAAPALRAATVSVGPERRQLTVMFCDLLDSTLHANRLGPEDWFEVIRSYQETASEVVTRFDGHVAQYLGDGLLVYFGYPRAHEDDAERAVRAGLGIVEAIGERNSELEQRYGLRLAIRLGIHTGPVVLGEMGKGDHRETLALGSTTNLAARVQSIAAPETVLVTSDTLRLVRGSFVTEDRGEHSLKGIDTPISVHRIVRSSRIRSRVDIADGRLTGFVGREQELGLLIDRWERTRRGEGQVTLVVGEAGVGKSRLASFFRTQMANDPHFWLNAYCGAFSAGASFAPILELLEHRLDFDQLDSADEKLRALEEVQLPGASPDQFVPYLAELLSLPQSQRYPLPQTSPELQRERMLDGLTAIVLALSRLRPVVLCVEDLHWCDPSTLEVVARLVERAKAASLMLLLTARPQFSPDWAHERAHVSTISLAGLVHTEATQLVTGMLAGKNLPGPVIRKLVSRADGVPLFLEELTKSVLDSGMVVERHDHYELSDATAHVEVPRTVQDSLTARLDQLSSAKQVAQLAATLGRRFHYELIEAIGELQAPALRTGLEQLVAAEILYRRGAPPEATYFFKHALLQDTAYESQLKTVRRKRHERIARVFEEHFPERIESEPETLAHHCAKGGLPEKAARYFEAAGQRAVKHLANEEAVNYFNQGLEELALMQKGPDRHQLEISLRAGLGVPLSWLRGLDAPEVVAGYERVRELADLVGEGPQQLAAWLGLVTYYTHTASTSSMRDLGHAILRSSEPLGVTPLTGVGHLLVGNFQNPLGPMSVAAVHLQKVVELGESGHLRSPDSAQEIDMMVVAKASLGIAELHLGRPGHAFALQQDAVARAHELDHANSLMIALILSAVGAYQTSAPELARAAVDEGIRLAEACDFRTQASHQRIYQGWLRVVDGDPTGADQAIGCLDEYLKSGSTTVLGWLYCVVGGTLHRAGRDEEAIHYLDRFDETIKRTCEWNYRPSAYLTRGLVHLDANRPDDAERWMMRARQAARESDSLNDELTIDLSLAPIWCQQGRQSDALELIASAYEGFQDGFELPLLRRARDEMSRLKAL
jgi:class 3 adenylate cyclase/tetratricopeptide (TPR) repeat protein